ncbi:hypothetical protein AAG570_006620 [Ranatra chinensis]|uniref:Uncharacterized protein n=1 Tax=Ranatra chinensis TaxID=642074 RepID=A0ABD0Z7A6_9HEMI
MLLNVCFLCFRLDFRPEEGRYDLHISNVSYARDDGKFECRLKVSGTGKDIHSQSYQVTVLTPPGAPRVGPSANPTATEGKPFEITCTTRGGSPDPDIKWFRQGQPEPIEAAVKSTTDQGVVSTLTLKPDKADDGITYKCAVWNRAMSRGSKLEATVTLNVNYFPRVQVGPENPYRVERDGTAKLECNVDAKPRVNNVRWIRDGRFISTSFKHTIQRVTVQDSGKYMCSADNGLGQPKEAEIYLDVQYPPQVTIESGSGTSRQKEVEDGEMVTIKCNVSANPPPLTVEWLREGRQDFRQNGEVLKLHRVSAESAGTYICRANNVLSPTSLTRQRSNRVGNASITILVRHRPGKAQITPDRPIASEGNGVTLTCSASPPGWPTPQYRWWRELDEPASDGQMTLLATGPKYNIPSAHLGSEGKYHCQGTNEMGHGDVATVVLTVHQPPRFLVKLQPHVTKRIGDSEFSVICGAQGKPKPTIRWLKDGKEISKGLFTVSTDESEGRSAVYTVQSTLRFNGRDRPSGSQLIPADRGVYSCIFENEVKKAESTMHLRIEHEPITLHPYNKVAYDLRETAEVVCKVQAYPRPEFQWSYSTNTAPLLAGSDGHYEINTTVNESGGDIYTSVLQISHLRQADYGEYNCRVANALGSVKTQIRLQPKGPPEKPEALAAIDIGHSHVNLQWKPGFDGGLQNTKYFVSYKKVLTASSDDCNSARKTGNNVESWHEFDCQRNNPCNVTSLEQHQSYLFKTILFQIKAYNTKGQSNYSDEAAAMTKVDKIPAPQHVTFDPDTHSLFINVAATCLKLIGMVEVSTGIYKDEWRIVDTVPLPPKSTSHRHEGKLNSLMPRRAAKTSGRSLDDHSIDSVRVRVKLCLETNTDTCGDYTEAEIGPSYMRETTTIAMPTLVAIVVSCIVFILFSCLAVVFCRCRRTQVKKATSKDYEMESSTVHPSIVQQAPPPYYPASGMENKALEHSMDLALDDNGKSPVYASQNGYGYHVNPQAHPNGGECSILLGVNMGYMENSYSNSNNGGSVNSQDSLWQMKMAAQANNAANMAPNPEHHHHHLSVYDPLAHGGYGTVDDYAPYPHLLPSASPDYSRSNNPSRQEYAPDKSLRQHHMGTNNLSVRIESPYRDVSGLPDPYLDHHMMMDPEDAMKQQQPPPQHMSMSFDESLESGYSTPNSRARRMIREIIV